MSDDFHKFFDRTTRLMERAMCEDHQSLFVDYTGENIILFEFSDFTEYFLAPPFNSAVALLFLLCFNT